MRSKESGVQERSDYYTYQPSAVASKLYLYPVVTGHFYYDPGYYLQRNKYDSILLMHIIDGACTGACGGNLFTAEKDQLVLLDCYLPHEYGNKTSSKTLDVVWLHFDGPLARSYYELITAGGQNVISPANTYTVSHNMKKILSLFREAAPIREASVSEYITKILTELLNGASHQAENSDTSHAQVVENSLAYINEHFSERISLEQLARASNLSLYYFTRVFRARTGFTPHQYLIATRLNSAKYLLQTSKIPVKEIAFSCGFNSESSFCSTFRKWENMTPGEFRMRSCRS